MEIYPNGPSDPSGLQQVSHNGHAMAWSLISGIDLGISLLTDGIRDRDDLTGSVNIVNANQMRSGKNGRCDRGERGVVALFRSRVDSVDLPQSPAKK